MSPKAAVSLRPLGVCAAAFALLAAAPSFAAAPPKRLVPARRLSPDELAAKSRDGALLFFQSAVFDPVVEAADFRALDLPAAERAEYGVVQFHAGRVGEKALLEARGVTFFGYVPDNAFQVRLTPEAVRTLSTSGAVRWLGPYEPGYKVHSRLWKDSGDPTPEVTVVFFPGSLFATAAAELARAFPDVVQTHLLDDPVSPRVRFSVPLSIRQDFVRRAASLPSTSWMEPWDPPQLHNNDALAPVQSNAATVLSAGACTTCTIFGKGITGTGQIVAVSDSGCDSDMCFFRKSAALGDVTDAENTIPPAVGTLFPSKKVIGYWVQPGATAYDNNNSCGGSPPTSWHGTHTSGTVVGDNFASLSNPTFPGVNTGDGMAPNAQLLFQDIGHDTTGCLAGLGDLFGTFRQARDGGARLHSNSWGSSTGGAYTSDDQTADRFLFDTDEMAVFFSAGNSGPGANTIGSPGNAKNVVTVGALGHGGSTTVASFSSRGPTDDGRIKPDIQAPGSSTISASGDTNHASNNCGTKALSGTSMSCPTVAGASALLRQYFADGFYPTGTATPANKLNPLASVIKAVLLNGTLPLPAGSTFGNANFGWGRIFLDNNLYFAGDARELRVFSLTNRDGLTTGETRTYTVAVAAGQEFRATLVWFDAEATLGVATTLVNNLDLTVFDGTSTYKGNVFSGTGVSIAGGAADVVNTVEQVRLTAPAAGTYTITVAAPSVPGTGRAYSNRQGFAVVVSYGACASVVTAAPALASVSSNPTMGADLVFTPAAGSTTTQIYRALGGCAAPIQDFQLVGTTAGTTFTDARAQGGFTYGYVVRGADGCGEGPASTCLAVTPTGRCDLVPSFTGLGSVAASGTQCRIKLAWSAASVPCPGGGSVRYNVYRSTTPGFTPSLGNKIATVTSLAYDDDAVASGVTYHYAVRAEDQSPAGTGPNGGNEEPNTKQLFATAFGPPGSLGTFTDDGGDTSAYLSNEAPWQLTTTQAQAGTRSYHCGPDLGTYSSNICAAITTPSLSLGTGSNLSYWVRFNAEHQWDGGVVEISTDGGANWTDLPPTTPAGYPDTLAQTGAPPVNACAYPSTHGAFTGPSGNAALTAWTQFQTNLSPAYDNKTVKIRWRFTSDPGAEFQGFYVDTISVTNVNLPGSCTPPPANTLPSFTPGAALSRQKGGPALAGSLGTVSDAETPAGSLGVAVASLPTGISLSGLVNSGGAVSAASVGAGCSATVGPNPVGIQVMDASAATSISNATVNVTPDAPPTAGNYPTMVVSLGGGVLVAPDAAPTDNGSVVSVTASAPGFTGSLGGDPVTGAITVSNAGPVGDVLVTVTTTDNCGSTTLRTFTLKVGAMRFYTLAPCRVADTRNPAGPYGGPALAGGATRSYTLPSVCGVPASAKAVASNITVVTPTGPGYLTLFPAGQSQPLASSINFESGQVRANNAVFLLGTSGQLSVFCGMAGGSTDFVVDVVGYFE